MLPMTAVDRVDSGMDSLRESPDQIINLKLTSLHLDKNVQNKDTSRKDSGETQNCY